MSRDLVRYPITYSEKVALLQQYFTQEVNSEKVGGNEASILKLIIADLESIPDIRSKVWDPVNGYRDEKEVTDQ